MFFKQISSVRSRTTKLTAVNKPSFIFLVSKLPNYYKIVLNAKTQKSGIPFAESLENIIKKIEADILYIQHKRLLEYCALLLTLGGGRFCDKSFQKQDFYLELT